MNETGHGGWGIKPTSRHPVGNPGIHSLTDLHYILVVTRLRRDTRARGLQNHLIHPFLIQLMSGIIVS